MLIATVVSGTGVTFGVLVGHGGTERIEDGTGCDILGGDEEDGLALALNFLLLWQQLVYTEERSLGRPYHNLSDLLVGVHQGLLHELS